MISEPANHDLFERWQRSLHHFGVKQADAKAAFADLVEAYSRPDRFYHTLKHIEQVLNTIQRLQGQVHYLELVQLAAWFHDGVYDPKAQDNEVQSARSAGAVLRSLGVPVSAIATVQQLILTTKHHQAAIDDADVQVLLDADLAILGANPDHYKEYAQAIRREYAWVPDATYRAKRKQVLEQFLQRDRIYFTALMFETAEQSARANLSAEVQRL
jgi:predicted metal-dependent HD superfamily phosphohydrolase